MLEAAKAAPGLNTLAVFTELCIFYSDEARREIGYRVAGGSRREPTPTTERNVRPKVAADRLGISVRKLTRGRFTVYRGICIPIEGQTRGYVVSERALDSLLTSQRSER